MRSPILPRRLLRIQSDQNEGRRRRSHLVHHPLQRILLQNNALWIGKCRSHVPTDDASVFERPNRQKRPSLCRRHRHQNLQRKHATRRPPRNLRNTQQVKNQAQPKKSACSASQPENCSGTWSLLRESKQTPKNSIQSLGCKNQQTSKAYSSLQED